MILDIYLSIALGAFFTSLGFYLSLREPGDDFLTLLISAIICGVLWPAIIIGALFKATGGGR